MVEGRAPVAGEVRTLPMRYPGDVSNRVFVRDAVEGWFESMLGVKIPGLSDDVIGVLYVLIGDPPRTPGKDQGMNLIERVPSVNIHPCLRGEDV